MTDMQLMINESNIGDLGKYIIPLGDFSGIKALRLIVEIEEILSHERD